MAPKWLPSAYMQAGSFLIIDSSISKTTTGSTVTPKGSIVFNRSFSDVPNLGYGISRY